MKSANSLLIESDSIRFTMKCLKLYSLVVISIFMATGTILVIVNTAYPNRFANHFLSCRSPEFIITDCFLIILLAVFVYFAKKVSSEISTSVVQTEENLLDPVDVQLNESRKDAMRNIWFLLGWLVVTSVEALMYSIMVYFEAGDHC